MKWELELNMIIGGMIWEDKGIQTVVYGKNLTEN